MRTKMRRYTERLPAVPVEPAMRKEVFDYGRETGLSVSEIQRRAISLFLSVNVSSTNIIALEVDKQEAKS
jgi:hypothetical protein